MNGQLIRLFTTTLSQKNSYNTFNGKLAIVPRFSSRRALIACHPTILRRRRARRNKAGASESGHSHICPLTAPAMLRPLSRT